MRCIIKNCNLINGIDDDIIENSYIVIEGDSITGIGQGNAPITPTD